MSFEPIHPSVGPLLQGIKPYLGSSGQNLAEGVLSLINLMASHHGKHAVQSMSQVLSGSGKSGRVITIPTGSGEISFSLHSAFVLFLILILLILSGNLLAISGSEAETTDDPNNSNPGNNTCV